MSAQLIDGKGVADRLISSVAHQVERRLRSGQAPPKLVVVIVGNDPASLIYVKRKKTACDQASIRSATLCLSATISLEELLSAISELNQDPSVHGILVQLPLPPHLDAKHVATSIDPEKDVDGFHPINLGRLLHKQPGLRPCTPQGIMALLSETQLPLIGLEAVIVGASATVGRPMALALLNAQCTVTVCHRQTRQLAQHVKRADLIVAAAGQVHLIRGDWIKIGAIVIDVGIHRLANGKLTGDVDFEKAKARAAWITPVPGGVGPMTVAKLIENTWLAAERQSNTKPC